MEELLVQYQPIAPATWAYVSSLLMIGLFFKFNRLWSVRNFDLLALILLAPGLLLVLGGRSASDQPEAVASANVESDGDEFAADGPVKEDIAEPSPAEANAEGEGGSGEEREEQIGEEQVASAPDARTGTAEAPTPSDAGQAADEGADAEVGAARPMDKATFQEGDSEEGEASTPADADDKSRGSEHLGYVLLFAAGGLLLARLLADPAMIRRPLLEPNLSPGGMAFVGFWLFVFLMANVATGPPASSGLAGAAAAERLASGQAKPGDLAPAASGDEGSFAQYGPGYPLLFVLPSISTSQLMLEGNSGQVEQQGRIRVATARVMAVLSHLAVVVGMIMVGLLHFDNVRTGVASATLYLMLPCTAAMTGRVDHCLPAALLVWMISAYRRPLVAGLLLGFCSGAIYYTFWLLPLWLSFYWQRGAKRFLQGIAISIAVLVVVLAFSSSSLADFGGYLQQMAGLRSPQGVQANGFWTGHPKWDRLPVLAAFVAISLSLALWPAQKNLGTLLSCSAAVMLGTQFWHAHGGGTFMAWYLPLALLTIFRPNLEDRVALSVLGDAWFERSRAPKAANGLVAASRATASADGAAWTEVGVSPSSRP